MRLELEDDEHFEANTQDSGQSERGYRCLKCGKVFPFRPTSRRGGYRAVVCHNGMVQFREALSSVLATRRQGGEIVRLLDGSTWPDPERCAEMEGRLRHHEMCRGDESETATIVAAYLHLLTHPSGTEAAVRKLREMRRRAKP